jgi:hypothetical protein
MMRPFIKMTHYAPKPKTFSAPITCYFAEDERPGFSSIDGGTGKEAVCFRIW